MRIRPTPDHLYVATDGVLFKIGISYNPAGRMRQLGAKIVKVYRRPYARALEAGVKNVLSDRCARGSEWFSITEAEMLEAVRQHVRVEDDYQAMQRGIEPSKRPGPGEPPHQPPFELQWLKVA